MHNKKPVFYIHIGLVKTGTSSIQHYLYKNRDELKKQGILFPDSRKISPHIKHKLWSPTQNPDYLKLWKRTITESRRYEKIIISLEGFSFLSIKEIEKLYSVLKTENVKILVYFRRYDQFIKSWYKQKIKANGETCSPSEFTERAINTIDYLDILDKWSFVFGIDNIIPRIYQSDQFDSITDFVSRLSINTNGLSPLKQTVNVGLSDSMTCLKRQINLTTNEKKIQKYIAGSMKKQLKVMKDKRTLISISFSNNQYEKLNGQINGIYNKYQYDFSSLLPPQSKVESDQEIKKKNVSLSDTAVLIVKLAEKAEKYDALKGNRIFKTLLKVCKKEV